MSNEYDYDLAELDAFAEENARPVRENGQIVGYKYPNGTIKYCLDGDEDEEEVDTYE